MKTLKPEYSIGYYCGHPFLGMWFEGDLVLNLSDMASVFNWTPDEFLMLDHVQREIENLSGVIKPLSAVFPYADENHAGLWGHWKIAIRFAGWLDDRVRMILQN